MKCYYEASEQKLHVEVLHAADLIALDANGNESIESEAELKLSGKYKAA